MGVERDAAPRLEERPWLAPVGLAVVGLVIVANAVGAVGFGATGDARFVTAGVVVYVAAAVPFLLWSDAPPRVVVALLLVMSGSAALTHHGDSASSGGVGLYLGMAFAPLRLPVRTAVVVSAIGVVVFDLQLLLEAANHAPFILVVTGGAAFFLALGVLLRREAEQRRRVAGLLRDLEASREAERSSAALAERARVAREVHDVLAHTLSGLVIQLDGATLLARSRGTAPDVVDAVARAHGLARAGLQEARQAVTALRGDSVPGPDLVPALVEEHRRSTGQQCRLRTEGEPRALPADARLTVYRTVQEALSNVRKHAPGADVGVRLAWGVDALSVEVQDTGGDHGVRPAAASGGHGLDGMRERAELLGGSLDAGRCGDGFRVLLRLPTDQVV